MRTLQGCVHSSQITHFKVLPRRNLSVGCVLHLIENHDRLRWRRPITAFNDTQATPRPVFASANPIWFSGVLESSSLAIFYGLQFCKSAAQFSVQVRSACSSTAIRSAEFRHSPTPPWLCGWRASHDRWIRRVRIADQVLAVVAGLRGSIVTCTGRSIEVPSTVRRRV